MRSSQPMNHKTKIFPFFTVLVLLIISILPGLTSCESRDEKAWREMLRADSLIESRPDSSFAILKAIDTTRLKGKEEQAKYALLMSMALDKNYIDTTDFSVLQPAIDYYTENGSPDEKLRTYYYMGRIYQNKHYEDDAMKSFLKALDYSANVNDSIVLARTHAALGNIYKERNSFEDYISHYLEAADLYDGVNRKDLSLDCRLWAMGGYSFLNDWQKADSLMAICKGQKKLCDYPDTDFNASCLTYYLNRGNQTELERLLENYDFKAVSSGDEWRLLANAFLTVGQVENAKKIYSQLDENTPGMGRAGYLAVKVKLAEAEGNYKEALDLYKQYSDEKYFIHKNTYETQSRFALESHRNELEVQRKTQEKQKLLWGSVGGFVILLFIIALLILLVRSNRAKKLMAQQRAEITALENERLQLEAERLRLDVASLTEERDSLSAAVKSNEGLTDEVKAVLKERLDMLNSILASRISDNDKYRKRYEDWAAKLAGNVERFMTSNRLAIQGTYPGFIEFLRAKGLTDEELDYICLYVMGLKGMEIGRYIRRPGHFNISRDIRKKLGSAVDDTNLGNYIRKTMDRFSR